MRYYIIGTTHSNLCEYDYAEQWLKLNGHTVISPCYITIKGLANNELAQVRMKLLSFADGVLVLDKSCDTYELSYAKLLGKKIKYLSKQWKLKQKQSRNVYTEENF